MSDESPDSPGPSIAQVTRDLTAAEIRATTFSVSKRGYQRDEVDRLRAAAAARVEDLEGRLAAVEATLGRLGITDLGPLKIEMDAVGRDVAAVLVAAEEAASGVRTRATADAAKWRAEAEQASRELTAAAQTEAEKARADAWAAAADLTDQTQAESAGLLDAARQDALFIRAEAEREALRLTGDARRDAEEALRGARTDAERRLAQARVEADEILEEARQSADSAQERARALERRRTELMEELEAARLSIGQLEQEIDSRKEALAGVTDVADAVAPHAVGGVGSPLGAGGDWIDADRSVRVVPAHAVVEEPVDADSLAAEVEALRRSIEDAARPAPEAVPPEPEPVAEEDSAGEMFDLPEPMDLEPLPVDELGGLVDEVGSAEESIEAAEPEFAAVAEPAAVEELEPAELPVVELPVVDEAVEAAEEPLAPGGSEPLSLDGPVAVDEPVPVDEPVEAKEPPPPVDLDGLFAALRSPPPPVSSGRPPTDQGAVSEADTGPAAEPGRAAGGDTAEKPSELSFVAPRAVDAPPNGLADPFEVRDRLLLPIGNRALRELKRRIVDLQNLALEELRVEGESWAPDRAAAVEALADEVARLAQESYVAGFAGAGELTGSAKTPATAGTPNDKGSDLLAVALGDAIGDALERTRASGGGARERSSAVGRVFRAWRTDEAERRVRRVAAATYHQGLLGGLAALGVVEVAAVELGVPCGRCPAGSGATWAPGAALPAGTEIPPATSSCSATIVPVLPAPAGREREGT
jgi:DivIVA domain-containing protein